MNQWRYWNLVTKKPLYKEKTVNGTKGKIKKENVHGEADAWQQTKTSLILISFLVEVSTTLNPAAADADCSKKSLEQKYTRSAACRTRASCYHWMRTKRSTPKISPSHQSHQHTLLMENRWAFNSLSLWFRLFITLLV